jgi:hypothetical protein
MSRSMGEKRGKRQALDALVVGPTRLNSAG